MADKRKPWPEIGTLRQKEGGKPYFILNKGVKIVIGEYNKETREYDNYKELDLGQYRKVTATDPMPRLEGLLKYNHITESDFEKETERLTQYGIRYNMAVPPSED